MGEPVELDVIEDATEGDEGAAVNTPKGDQSQHLRMLEALLFAATEPVAIEVLEDRMPDGADVAALLDELKEIYQNRGVHVICVGGKWCLRIGGRVGGQGGDELVQRVNLSLGWGGPKTTGSTPPAAKPAPTKATPPK